MDLFNLPKTTIIERVIPKNAFDDFVTSKQKKVIFVDAIERIRWKNKLSKDTINLIGEDVTEIQIFEIQLKKQTNTLTISDILNKNIPYQLILIFTIDEMIQTSLCKKHANPQNEEKMVIDWAFQSEWSHITNNKYLIDLKISLDHIYDDLCKQVSGSKNQNIEDIIYIQKELQNLDRIKNKLIASIKKSKQFNKKVELNRAY